ncbi:hypothetical protein K488DRAFT_38373, partial [Vararia minispora EC-137]
GTAVWIMIHADDAPRIGLELREHPDFVSSGNVGHPVHSQCIFLRPSEVLELREKGFRVYRIEQWEGDAVFIPSGTPHQVTNLSDSIKVACDFICPLHVDSTEKTASELRQ